MTVENVDALEEALTDTTTAQPSLDTEVTGTRTTAPTSINYGFGILSVDRAVAGRETTIIDRRFAQAAAVGLTAAFGGALLRRTLEKND